MKTEYLFRLSLEQRYLPECILMKSNAPQIYLVYSTAYHLMNRLRIKRVVLSTNMLAKAFSFLFQMPKLRLPHFTTI